MATTPSIAMIPSGYKANKVYSVLPTDGSGDLDFARTTTATRVNQNGLIEEVAIGVPRLDYTDGSCPSLLLEPSSINLITYSEDYSNASWIKEGQGAIDLNTEISPTGILNASYLKAGSGSSITPRISQIFTSEPNKTYIGSVFIKKDNIDWIRLLSTGATADIVDAYYNVSEGVLGVQGTPSKAKIEDYSNGWYRLSLDIDSVNSTTSATFRIQLTTADGSGVSDFDGTEKNIIFGAQLEQQYSSTSYIKTEGTAISRTADSASKSGISSLINSSEGTLFVEMSALADDGTLRSVGLAKNSSTDDMISIEYTETTNQIRYLYRHSLTSVASLFYTLSDSKDSIKVAATWKLDEFKFYINGVSVGFIGVGSVALSNTFSILNFKRPDSSTELEGKVKSLQVFKTALTDEELTILTTI